MIDLTGKISIVTGGAQGIGRSIALTLARKGSDVIIADVNIQKACETAEEIRKINGLDIVREPTMNIVGIRSDSFDIRRTTKELRLRKWAASLFPKHIRIVIMPHVQKQHIHKFLEDLEDIVDKLGG